jgi:PAS domain S-box-containing protein
MISPIQQRPWPSQRKLSAIFAVAIALLIANVAFTVRNIRSLTISSKLITRSHDVVKLLDDVHSSLLEARISRDKFTRTGNGVDLEGFRRSIANATRSIDKLTENTAGSPTRPAQFERVRAAVQALVAELKRTIPESAHGAMVTREIASLVTKNDAQINELTAEFQRRYDAMEVDETQTRKELTDRRNELFAWTNLAFLVASGFDLLLLLLVNYISARRRRELVLNAEWLSTTLRSIGDAVIATDAVGRIAFMNEVAEGLTGWTEAEAKGIPLEQVFTIVDELTREPTDNPVGRVLATGGIQELSNHTLLIAKDGCERPIDDSAAPIKISGGAIQGVVLVFRDVTREKTAQAERERLCRELSERDRRKDEFLAMLAHELRNPLAAIGNAVMLSSRSDLRDHLDWSLDVIRRQMRHLSRLIDDLLDVSRISRGKIELKCERIDVAMVLRDAIDSVRPLIEQRGHTLDTRVAPEKLWANADPTRLEQVVVNLLNNAAKYTEPGGKIELSGTVDGDWVVISVSDTGIGIPPERLPEMFELFTQGDRSLARSEGGLGIGLTVVKKLVEMHGGSITARSSGQGSEFTIRIPVADSEGNGWAEPRVTERVRDAARILIVEDNEDTRLGISKILSLLGHRVASAATGIEAIEVARATRPEFILLDVGLPGMDGYEVARRLRREESCRDAVIIAVTGYGHEVDRILGRASGFDHHLIKPLDHETLVTLLSRG